MPRTSHCIIRLLRLVSAAFALAIAPPILAQGFGPPTLIPTGNQPVFVASADFNNDGIPDLLYIDAGATAAASTTHILLGDGKGGFTQSAVLTTAGNSVAIGHLSRTAHVDIAWLSSTATSGGFDVTWTIAQGYGDGTFGTHIQGGPATPFNVPLPFSFAFAKAADAAARSSILPAIVAVDSANGYVFSLPIEPTGLTSTSTQLTHGAGPLILADLNGDGTDDFLVDAQLDFTAQVFLGANPNSGTAFTEFNGNTFTGTTGVYSLAVADFNHDTIPDLAVEGSSGRVDIFPGNGDGTFQSSSIGGTTSLDSTTGDGGRLITAVDLNGDKLPDLLTYTPLGVSVELGTASGNFHFNGAFTAGPGTHTSFATADFNHDGFLDVAMDGPDGIVILYGQALSASESAFTLTATPEPSAFEASFTLTATLVPPSGGPTPTGTVTFLITQPTPLGGGPTPPPVQQTVPLQNGIATSTVPAVSPSTTGTGYLPGRDTLTASYSGDTNYPALPSFTGSHTVQLGLTSVTLTPAPPLNQLLSTYFYGQPVNGFVNFFPQDPRYPVTGTWSQLSNGVVVPGCAAIPATTAGSCPYGYPQLLDSGTYSFVEAYNGDPINGAAQSAPYNFGVEPDTTSFTSLNSSLNPAIAGTAVTFTATFTGNFAVPTGSVNFFDNGNLIGSAPLNANGSAAFTSSTLAVGTHPISAQYPGNIDFGPAATSVLQQVILPNIPAVHSTITLTSSANPAALGTSVVFTAIITVPGNPQLIPSGSISFFDGTQLLGTGAISPSGQATFTTSTLALGSHPITASFPGQPETASSAAVLPAVSPVLNQQIDVPGFVLTINPSSTFIPAGQTAVILVTVSDAFGLPGPLALTCSGLPGESSCSFEGAPIPATGGTAALQLATSAPHPCGDPTHPYGNSSLASCPGRSQPTASSLHIQGLRIAIPSLALLVLLVPRRRLRLRNPLLLVALLACLSALNACGGTCTDLGTPLASYTVIITATPPPGSIPAQSASLHIKVVPQ